MPDTDISPLIAAGEHWIRTTMDDNAEMAAGYVTDRAAALHKQETARKKAAADFTEALTRYIDDRFRELTAGRR